MKPQYIKTHTNEAYDKTEDRCKLAARREASAAAVASRHNGAPRWTPLQREATAAAEAAARPSCLLLGGSQLTVTF